MPVPLQTEVASCSAAFTALSRRQHLQHQQQNVLQDAQLRGPRCPNKYKLPGEYPFYFIHFGDQLGSVNTPRYRGAKADIDSPFGKLHYRATATDCFMATVCFMATLLVTANKFWGKTINFYTSTPSGPPPPPSGSCATPTSRLLAPMPAVNGCAPSLID